MRPLSGKHRFHISRSLWLPEGRERTFVSRFVRIGIGGGHEIKYNQKWKFDGYFHLKKNDKKNFLILIFGKKLLSGSPFESPITSLFGGFNPLASVGL